MSVGSLPADELEVLLIEDNPGDAKLIQHNLRRETSGAFSTPELTHVESLDAGLAELAAEPYDLVLLDLGLQESSGLATLERLTEALAAGGFDPVPVVVLTGLRDDEAALEAIQTGAQDYLVKDEIDGPALERSIRYALERHRQARQLERQNERLDQFAGVVSHDLRNPLNVAASHLELLRDDCDSESIADIENALQRMEAIIEDVLTLARQGETVDETEPVSLQGVTERAWSSVATGGAELVIEAETGVEADPGRLIQLLENLLRNAIEHGGPRVTITVESIPEGFALADDGEGFGDADPDELFEHGYSTAADGTGFGLSIVAEIAAAHGWDVAAAESDAGGARFEITGVEHVAEPN